ILSALRRLAPAFFERPGTSEAIARMHARREFTKLIPAPANPPSAFSFPREKTTAPAFQPKTKTNS
ncbi:MAG: hypothetical protein ABMA01_18555, partial [Chthoniobacteraceae bacterium]